MGGSNIACRDMVGGSAALVIVLSKPMASCHSFPFPALLSVVCACGVCACLVVGASMIVVDFVMRESWSVVIVIEVVVHVIVHGVIMHVRWCVVKVVVSVLMVVCV